METNTDQNEYRASIAIFKSEFEYPTNDSCPIVPALLFEAVQKVIKSKGCEFIKSRDGIYIVRYSESGPYQLKMSDEWMPVYVAKVFHWASGGVKKSEMQDYLDTNPQPVIEEKIVNDNPND